MNRFSPYAALGLLVFATTTASAEPIFPRGSGVGIEPPAPMAVSDDFLGFQFGLSSILITELPAVAYAQIDRSRSRMTAKIDDAKIEDLSLGGMRGFIIRGRQTLGNRVYRKWAVVLGSPNETAMITVQVPVAVKEVTDGAVEAALRTIVLRGRPDTAEQISALPFKVGDLAGFRATGALMGASEGFTEGPKDVDPEQNQPHVVVSTSLNHPPAQAERLVFAEQVLRAMTAIRTTQVRSARLLAVDGAQWAEIRASGSQGKVDAPVEISLFIRFGEGDYITIVGTARAGGTDYADRFRQLALSVTPKG